MRKKPGEQCSRFYFPSCWSHAGCIRRKAAWSFSALDIGQWFHKSPPVFFTLAALVWPSCLWNAAILPVSSIWCLPMASLASWGVCPPLIRVLNKIQCGVLANLHLPEADKKFLWSGRSSHSGVAYLPPGRDDRSDHTSKWSASGKCKNNLSTFSDTLRWINHLKRNLSLYVWF